MADIGSRSNMQKNETRPLTHTIHKGKLKMDEDLNVRQETIKTLDEKAGKNLSDLSHSNFLLDTSPKARELKAKYELLGLHEDKKLLNCKGNNQQN